MNDSFNLPRAASVVIIHLFKGVLYQDQRPEQWRDLLQNQAAVSDYVAAIGLQLYLDEAEGYAFLRQRPEGTDEEEETEPLPRLVQRRPLSYPVSLLCVLLRKKLVELDAAGGETRLILSRDQMVEMLRVFLGERSNEAKLVDQIDGHIAKVADFGFLRRLKKDEDNYEARRIIKALENREAWPGALAVCRFLRDNPRPGRYIRELDIAGVDSKFIEQHKSLLRELLDIVLPPEAADPESASLSGHGFERRYGFRYDEPLIRFRILDPECAGPWGVSDISVPLHQFLTLDPPCDRVVITENKTNGLSFPPLARSMVVFGLGYGISSLRDAAWLGEKEILYWGDIDTHGFSILSRLRGFFPGARSLLMDRETLMEFRGLWGREDDDKRCAADLGNLVETERRLYSDLRDNILGENIRLEQERIAFACLKKTLSSLVEP